MIKAALELGHIPVGMAMFSAGNEAQWDLIKRTIDDCDYYAVIIAHRYGSTDSQGVSFTEKEYDYAVSCEIPVLGFLIDKDAQWPPSSIERSADASLTRFKDKVKSRIISYWKSQEDLNSKFVTAISKAINSHPRPGWVRSSGQESAKVAEELLRLSKENEILRAAVAKNGASSQRLRELIGVLKSNKTEVHMYNSISKEWERSFPVDLLNLFHKWAQHLILGAELNQNVSESENIFAPLTNPTEPASFTVSRRDTRTVLMDFFSFDLADVRRTEDVDAYGQTTISEKWKFTELGRDLYRYVRIEQMKRSKSK